MGAGVGGGGGSGGWQWGWGWGVLISAFTVIHYVISIVQLVVSIHFSATRRQKRFTSQDLHCIPASHVPEQPSTCYGWC